MKFYSRIMIIILNTVFLYKRIIASYIFLSRDVDIEAQFSLNQSRAEEITMREDYGNLSLVTHDQGFGDMSFDAEPPELLRHGGVIEPSLDQVSTFLCFPNIFEHCIC